MCSNLFVIPSHVGGVPVFGFGLLLLALVAIAGVWAAWRWRQPHGRDEVLAALPVLGIMAVAIVLLPRIFPEGFPVRGYGTMLIVAATSGLWLACRRARQAGIHTDLIFSLALWMFVLGIVGGRVFYVIEYWETLSAGRSLREAAVEALKYANGGLVVYGALVGAALAFLLFVWRHRLPVLAMADLIAPSLVVGLAFGRIGCLLNGCCFGGVSDVPWAVTFPQEGQAQYSPPYAAQLARGEFFGLQVTDNDGRVVIEHVVDNTAAARAGLQVGDVVTHLGGTQVTSAEQAAERLRQALEDQEPLTVQTADKPPAELAAVPLPPRSLPVHPTQLYSAVNAGLLGWFLWSYYPARRRDGEVFALLITLYPIGRFLLEVIRVDETSFLGTGLSISQNVSLVLLALVVLLWIYLARQPRGRVFDAASPAPQPA